MIDTNVLVSAVVSKPGSTTRRLLDEIIAGRLEIVLSRELIDEFVDVMSRPKLARHITVGAFIDFLEQMLSRASMVDITGEPRGCKDPDDDAVIETAEVGAVRYLITGDRDLFDNSIRAGLAARGIEVITAGDFSGETALDQARTIVAVARLAAVVPPGEITFSSFIRFRISPDPKQLMVQILLDRRLLPGSQNHPRSPDHILFLA